MSVQRYGIPTTFVSTNDPDGPWVLYTDHVAALAEERADALREARDYLLTHNRSETLTWMQEQK
jgi:hypothetical protein